jgi:hypothetical protein
MLSLRYVAGRARSLNQSHPHDHLQRRHHLLRGSQNPLANVGTSR